MRSVRFGACTLALVALAAALGGSADSARRDGGADWMLRPILPTQKLLRVDVQGDTLYGFRLRGTGLTVTGVKSVRASGGPTPSCSVSGTPATLACDGDLVGGISVFVQLEASGSGGYDFAFLFEPNDPNLIYVPSQERAAPVPLGGSLGMTSPTAGRVTIHNSGKTTFQQLEVDPIGFTVTNVLDPDCGVTEGAGIACMRPLAPGGTAVIRFVTAPTSDPGSAYLVAQGDQTGIAYVLAGDPCPDLAASLARLQSEAVVLKSHIARMARVGKARPLLGSLRRKLTGLEKKVRAAGRRVEQCQAGQRKVAAAAACDRNGLAVAKAQGTVVGLLAVLPTERRVAAKVRALRALPAQTNKALAAAKLKASRAGAGLLGCEIALEQG